MQVILFLLSQYFFSCFRFAFLIQDIDNDGYIYKFHSCFWSEIFLIHDKEYISVCVGTEDDGRKENQLQQIENKTIHW